MAGQSPSKLDRWRKFFRKSNCSIVDTIENAIQIAKIDYPDELQTNRVHIAEILSTNVSPHECQCRNRPHHVEPESSSNESTNVQVQSFRATSSESVDSESRSIRKVLRIKDSLMIEQEESAVLELLTELQQMEITVDEIKSTEIFSVVNGFKRHKAKSVQRLAYSLIESWKIAAYKKCSLI